MGRLNGLLGEIDNKIAFLRTRDGDKSESVKRGLLIDIIVKARDMGYSYCFQGRSTRSLFREVSRKSIGKRFDVTDV